MIKELVAVTQDEFNQHSDVYELPIAQEELRAGMVVFIDFVADAETYGVFELDPAAASTPSREQWGMVLVNTALGQPARIIARGGVTSSDAGARMVGAIFGTNEPLFWAVKKS